MTISRPASRQPIPSSARRVFKGKIFDVYQWEQVQFDGTITTFEKLKRPDTVYVIPVTTDQKLVIAKQKQPGAAPFFGLLGGRVEDGEEPDVAAARELLEEAGLRAGDLVFWDSYQFLPKIDWAIFTFIAKDCRQIQQPELDAGEDIGLTYVTFEEFIDLVRQEKFGDVEVALRVLRLAMDPGRLNETKRLLFE